MIVGAGYIGRAVAKLLLEQDQPVHAVVASARSEQRLKHLGVETSRVDIDDDQQLENLALPVATQVVYMVPPDRQSLSDTRLQRFARHLSPPHRLVYLSTSGVYGNCDGALVDEHRPPNPSSDRARRRLDAEQRVQTWTFNDAIAGRRKTADRARGSASRESNSSRRFSHGGGVCFTQRLDARRLQH